MTNVASDGACGGRDTMPRVDRSVRILTGMIIAALYVIMLVGFAQESYMRRDAADRSVAGCSEERTALVALL